MNFDPTITIGALGLLITLAGFAISVLVALRKMRRENETDTRAGTERIEKLLQDKHNENRDLLNELKISLGERVSKLEATSGGFVPRPEIEAKFEHEKNNRLAQGEAIGRRLERQDSDMRDVMVRVGGLAQRQDSHDTQLVKLETIMREGFDRASEKLNRLADTVRGGKV